MRRRNLIMGIFSAAGMLILILDSRTAVSGAQSGIDICIRTVIPALFPFFLLSILLTSSLSGASTPVLKPLEKYTGIPTGAGVILLTGFLGGYPTGAKCIASAYRCGKLNRTEAERMLAFCNNAGPAFLFGMVGPSFSSPTTAFRLWMIHILSALLTAGFIPSTADSTPPVFSQKSRVSVSLGMREALSAMAAVCGWVILFRVLLSFLDRWFLWILPSEIQVLLTGMLELSNGCCILSSVSNADIRFVICSCILALGGLCVAMQTASAAEGLSLKYYIPGKLLQTAFSILLSISSVLRISIPVTALLLFVVTLQKWQKRSSNPETVVV